MKRFGTIGGAARLLAVGLVLLLSGRAVAHYIDLDRALVESGTLVFGVALTGTPFAYKRDGELRGFEIEVARAVAAAHGLQLRLVQLPRRNLVQALAAGEVDAINTLALPPETNAVRPVPYLMVGDHMMILRGNPFRVRKDMDLRGRTVAVTAGSSAEDYAFEINERLQDAGHETMNIHSFPDQRFTHFPVSMGHAAAYFVQTVSAVAITHDPEARAKLVPGAFRPRREVGFGIRDGNEELLHALEHALAGMVATGRYEALRTDHDLPIDLSPYR